jgi:hypothetical protein
MNKGMTSKGWSSRLTIPKMLILERKKSLKLSRIHLATDTRVKLV